MTKILPLIITVQIILLSCSLGSSNLITEPKKGEALICSQTGEIQGRSKKSHSWENIHSGDIIKEGYEIRIKEGELYLQTGDGIIIRMDDSSELTFHYDSKNELTSLNITKGRISVRNPGVHLKLEIPGLSLYSEEGIFSLLENEERCEIYNNEGDLRLLPGIIDLNPLAEVLDDKDSNLPRLILENQRPLFPGETWYLDDALLRDQTKLYNELLLRLKGEILLREEIDELMNEILSMDITITEYSQVDMTSTMAGFSLFSGPYGEKRVNVSLNSDEGALLSTSHSSGLSYMELILPVNMTIPLKIRKAGYQSQETTVTAVETETSQDNHYFKLPRLTSRKISVSINPPESEITINGIYAGKGNIVLEVKPDEPLELNMTLDGYNEQYLYLDGEQELPESIEIELKKTIEKVVRGAYQEIIGLAGQGEDIYVSDWSGIIWYVHEPSNWRRYNTRTNNYPNTLSEPVLTENYIYFSGKRSFVVINRISGAALTVTRLNDRENHLKGQKAVPMDYQVLFPTKDSIRFLTGDGKKIREVFIPGGSLMTPAIYDGKIYTVATDGQIYEISTNGKILRSLETETESPMGQSIVFNNGRGYFCDSRGEVAAFSPASMSLEWKSSPIEDKGSFIRDVLLTEEKVYLYGGTTLYAVDRQTGKAQESLEGEILTSPLLLGEYIYAMTSEETLGVFSSETGMPVKKIELGYEVTSPIYPYEDKIMAGTFDGNVLIMNQLDSSLLSKPIK